MVLKITKKKKIKGKSKQVGLQLFKSVHRYNFQ